MFPNKCGQSVAGIHGSVSRGIGYLGKQNVSQCETLILGVKNRRRYHQNPYLFETVVGDTIGLSLFATILDIIWRVYTKVHA